MGGIGISYTSPLQALIQWFPEKKGLATGMCIGGFGGGALLMTPMSSYLMNRFKTDPTYLGSVSDVPYKTDPDTGRMFAETADGLKEVVVAGASDIAKLSGDFAEGLYLVGSGN